MTDERILEPSEPDDKPVINWSTLLLVLLLSLIAATFGYWMGNRQTTGPGKSSADAGFARDMMTHHAQAVDMATLMRDRTDDPQMRQLALDIMLTQQAQIGQMQGWLTVWGYPIASTDPAMSWMGMPTMGPMPGMATPEQLNQLRNLNGNEADGLFLQLMIAHHRGGVIMAEAALQLAKQPAVRALAQSIVNAQMSEIALMQELLLQKGFPPVPEESGMSDDGTMTP